VGRNLQYHIAGEAENTVATYAPSMTSGGINIHIGKRGGLVILRYIIGYIGGP
jgi:hypothetical protein